MSALRPLDPNDPESLRLSTTFTYTSIQSIGNIRFPPLRRQHSAGGESVVSSVGSITDPEDKSDNKQIKGKEQCMVTNRTTCGLEGAHLVNAARSDKFRKLQVETFLKGLRIVEQRFSLNSACNIVSLDHIIHYPLDNMGYWALTCSKNTLEALSALLDVENKTYEVRYRDYTRFFERRQPPFIDATYEMVILHPDHFLPLGQTLTAYKQDTHGLFHPTLYAISPDGALRQHGNPNFGVCPDDPQSDVTWKYAAINSSPRMPPFPAAQRETQRGRPPLTANPFLAILNADMAFRRYSRIPNRTPLCAEYEELIRLTTEVADKIYYRPIVSDVIHPKKPAMELEVFDAMQVDQPSTSQTTLDDFNPTGGDKEATIKASAQGRRRDGGAHVSEVNAESTDAMADQFVDHFRFLLSTRDPVPSKDDFDEDETDSDEDSRFFDGGADADDEGRNSPVFQPALATSIQV